MEASPDKTPDSKRKLIIIITITLAALLLILGGYAYSILRNELSTDDAYISGNTIPVSSQIKGSVVTIEHTDTELVKQGDILVTLDKTNARLAYQKARSNLAYSVRQMRQLALQDLHYQASIRQAQIAYNQAAEDYGRQQQLADDSLVAKESLEHARDAAESSKAALDAATRQYQANKALLLDTPLNQQPLVIQAADTLREAWLTLQRTEIRSPVTGYIARRNVQPGQTIQPGQTLMYVVPEAQMWINANFKETQLKAVRIGQKASIVSDLYGSKVVYSGYVSGIAMGTGGAFALLPAQNASGNWIKVVQRVPVRIELDDAMLASYPLRIGLSTTTTIHLEDVDDKRLESLPQQVVAKPALSSHALVLNTREIDQEIAEIIARNGGDQ